MTERVALLLPVLQDPVERVLFQPYTDAHLLLVSAAALEEPGIGILPDVVAGFDNLRPRRAGVVLEIGHKPQLKRMNAGHITAVLQRKLAGVVFSIKVPEIVVADRIARQIAGKKGTERRPAGFRLDRLKDHGQTPRNGPRAMRQERQRLVGRSAPVDAIEAIEINAALLVDKAPQIGLP